MAYKKGRMRQMMSGAGAKIQSLRRRASNTGKKLKSTKNTFYLIAAAFALLSVLGFIKYDFKKSVNN